MDVSEDDLFFINENDSIHTNEIINHSKLDFEINSIFSNINPNNSSQRNKVENIYQINNDSSNQNPTEVSSQQEQILSKKVKRKQKSIEEIRKKNRERTKKSREKRIRDILIMVKQIETLKRENDKLTNKISKLCPKCQQIMNNDQYNKSIKSSTQDDTFSSSSDSHNASLVTNNLNGGYQSFTRKIIPLFTVIGLICLLSSITLFYFDYYTSRNVLKQNNQFQGNKKRRLLFEKNYLNDTMEDNKCSDYSSLNNNNDHNFIQYQCGYENKKENNYDNFFSFR